MSQSSARQPLEYESVGEIEYPPPKYSFIDLVSDHSLDVCHAFTAMLSSVVSLTLFGKLTKAREQLQEALGSIPIARALDIGMTPGGFATSILETYQEAKVIGVILPLSQGRGPDWISIDRWSSIGRLRVHFQDITKYALGRVPDEQHQNFIWTNDMNLGSYDLVICNGQLLYNMSASDPRTADPQSRVVQRSRLIFSQLILALHHVKQGSALVINLGDMNGRFAIKLIYVIGVFAKPRLLELQRGNYSALYLVATDIDTGHPLATEFLDELKVCWSAATFENVPATVTDTDFSRFLSLSNELFKTMDHLSELTSLLTEEDFDAFIAVFSS